MKILDDKIIIDFLTKNFPLLKFNDSRSEMRINSPFTHDEKFKCYVNPTKSKFIDYKSGLKGSFNTFLKQYLNLNSDNEVDDYLLKSYFDLNKIDDYLNNKQIENIKKVSKELTIPKEIKYFSEELSYIGKKAYNYLINRGFDKKTILDYKLGYFFDGEYKNRIFIPFIENGEIVYFISRSFDGSLLRYKNPSEVNSKKFLFNYDKLEGTIGICEGVFDAMYLKYPVTTSCLSTTLSDEQCKKILSKNINNIIIIPDNDYASYSNIRNNYKMLIKNKEFNKKVNFYIYEYIGGKDLNEAKINYINLDDCKKLNELYFLNNNKFREEK